MTPVSSPSQGDKTPGNTVSVPVLAVYCLLASVAGAGFIVACCVLMPAP